MPIVFPANLDAFTNPSAANNLNTAGVLHDVQHSDANDAIEAIENILVGRPWHNVRGAPYNAVGDGVNDDTAEIQAAIDAAETDGGGTVYFPDGTYKISSPLLLHSGVTLKGNGRRNSIISVAVTNVHGIEALGASAGSTIVQINIEDLKITGPGEASGGTGAGIHVKWASVHLSIARCWIVTWGSHGVFVEDSYSFAIRDTLLDSNGGNGFHGITNINNATFDHCISIGNTGKGYYVEGGTTTLFLNSDAESNGGIGLDLRYVHVPNVIGCHFEQNGTANINLHFKTSLSDKTAQALITGCLIQGGAVTARGIVVDGSERALISGNWFNNHTVDHIQTTANATRTTIGPNQYGGTGTILTDASSSTWGLHHGPVKTVTINPASIPANSAANQFVSMPSAAVGDAVAIGPPAALEAGLVVTGYVSAVDVVQIRIANVTTGAIDPASGNWRVAVLKA